MAAAGQTAPPNSGLCVTIRTGTVRFCYVTRLSTKFTSTVFLLLMDQRCISFNQYRPSAVRLRPLTGRRICALWFFTEMTMLKFVSLSVYETDRGKEKVKPGLLHALFL